MCKKFQYWELVGKLYPSNKEYCDQGLEELSSGTAWVYHFYSKLIETGWLLYVLSQWAIFVSDRCLTSVRRQAIPRINAEVINWTHEYTIQWNFSHVPLYVPDCVNHIPWMMGGNIKNISQKIRRKIRSFHNLIFAFHTNSVITSGRDNIW